MALQGPTTFDSPDTLKLHVCLLKGSRIPSPYHVSLHLKRGFSVDPKTWRIDPGCTISSTGSQQRHRNQPLMACLPFSSARRGFVPHLAADTWSGGSGFFAVLSGPRENSEFVVLSCDIIPIRFDAHLPLAINVITNKSLATTDTLQSLLAIHQLLPAVRMRSKDPWARRSLTVREKELFLRAKVNFMRPSKTKFSSLGTNFPIWSSALLLHTGRLQIPPEPLPFSACPQGSWPSESCLLISHNPFQLAVGGSEWTR